MSLYRRPSSGVRGATGATGGVGPAGAAGDSAYDIAVSNGFSGTEAEWLDTLGDPVPYAERVDFVGDTIIYKGWAVASTANNANAVWRIRRTTFTGDDMSKEWADGNTNFDKIWDNRASLTYS